MSANSLSAIIPVILARGLKVLRESCVFPRLVNGDYSADAAKKGSAILVPVPVAVTTTGVSPAVTPVDKTGLTPATVSVPLDNWQQNLPVGLTDQDFLKVSTSEDFLPMALAGAIKALAVDVNAEIASNYKNASQGIYGLAGAWADGAGATPFDATYQGIAGAVQARKVLNRQLCPRFDRRGVVDLDAEANMLSLAQFSDAEKIMSAVVRIEGEIGRKYGIDWVAEDALPSHTAGTLNEDNLVGALTVTGTEAIGQTAITLGSDSGSDDGKTVKAGDIVTFTGDAVNSYMVLADATMSGQAVTFNIYPALKVAVSSTCHVHETHVLNQVFNRDAYAFATRSLINPITDNLGSRILSMQDPITGMVLRLEVSRQHKQTVWEYDILWGSLLVRPELATRIIGAAS